MYEGLGARTFYTTLIYKWNWIYQERTTAEQFFSEFAIELFGVKAQHNLLGILSNFWPKVPPSTHIYMRSAAHIFTSQDLQRIRCYFDLDSAKLLANTLVSSHLNTANSLLFGIADTDFTKLQRIQNRLSVLWQSHNQLVAVCDCCIPFSLITVII